MTARVIIGDVRERLSELEPGSVQTCITSPPYFGLRDYGHDGQIGLEPTPDEYVAEMVGVFRLVRDVLTDDGTLWLNLGDSYNGSGGSGGSGEASAKQITSLGSFHGAHVKAIAGLKPKDLIGIPWRVAFALQADGWYLRQDIIWSKPNPMPESVTDRCTKSHEYLFLLSKSARYFDDHEAVRQPDTGSDHPRAVLDGPSLELSGGLRTRHTGLRTTTGRVGQGANKRSVWNIAVRPFYGAHFAVMPEALVEPCILAGSAHGDLVLDPFAGSGTVGVVAKRYGRKFVGVELNPEYAQMAENRIAGQHDVLPMVIA